MSLEGHLVMLHGMTGTASKMMPLAESLVPSGWGVYCPEGPFAHPSGGKAWWIDGLDKTETVPDMVSQISISMDKLENELPSGKLILGGFSQGGAIASAFTSRISFERVLGLVLIATKTVDASELGKRLVEVAPRPVIWMHGERDPIIPIHEAVRHMNCFLDAGWEVEEFRHGKGHMVDLSQRGAMVRSIEGIARPD